MLFKKACEDGLSDILSAEGPDEYLGGYTAYTFLVHEQRLYEQPELANYKTAIDKYLGSPIERFSRIIGDDTQLLMGSAIYNEYAMISEKSEEDEERLLTHSQYDLYYNITNYGSNLTKDAGISRKVQTFAGNLLFNALDEAE